MKRKILSILVVLSLSTSPALAAEKKTKEADMGLVTIGAVAIGVAFVWGYLSGRKDAYLTIAKNCEMKDLKPKGTGIAMKCRPAKK